MGLLKKLAGGILQGVGEGLVVNGKSLREQKRAQLLDERATARIQMGVTSREKTAAATLGERTRSDKVKEDLLLKTLDENVRERGLSRADLRAAAKTKNEQITAKGKRDVNKMRRDAALIYAKVPNPTGETGSYVDPTKYNEFIKAAKAGMPLPVPLRTLTPGEKGTTIGERARAASGAEVEWDGKGWKYPAAR